MLNHNLFSFNFTYSCICAQLQVAALCHGLHVEVRGERCRVSFLLHLYEIQGTGLCSFVYLFICCLRQSLSRSLPFQQHCLASNPGSCLSWTLDAAARPNSLPGTHTQVRVLVQQALHPLSLLPVWKPLIALSLNHYFMRKDGVFPGSSRGLTARRCSQVFHGCHGVPLCAPFPSVCVSFII